MCELFRSLARLDTPKLFKLELDARLAKNSSENLARFVLDVESFLNMIIFPFCRLFWILVAVALRPSSTFELESLVRRNIESVVAAGDDNCRCILRLLRLLSFFWKPSLPIFAKFVVLDRVTKLPELPPYLVLSGLVKLLLFHPAAPPDLMLISRLLSLVIVVSAPTESLLLLLFMVLLPVRLLSPLPSIIRWFPLRSN